MIFRLLVLAGLALSVVAYFVPRETGSVSLVDGDRGIVDEAVELRLVRFSIPTYPSGKPRQFMSEVRLSEDGGETWSEAEIAVNRPLRAKGWWIYQASYMTDAAGRLVTQLQYVREPAFPLAVVGWALALLGAFGMCFSFRPDFPVVAAGRFRKILCWAFAVATVCVPVFVIGRAVLRPEPVPALQSALMAPHVAAYAASYLILLFAAFGIGRRFMAVGYFLMTCGLVLGAWWGKLAWGSWWQCDPKELWSLATWLGYTAYFFVWTRPRAEVFLRIAGAVLVVLTLTWANYSRLFVGLHSYA